MEDEKGITVSLKSGFTWRSYLAVLYAIFIFSPAVIWLSLATVGGGLGAAIRFTTLILVVELARFSGSRLTKQEAIIIFLLTGIAAEVPLFLDLIYSLYYVHSPIAQQFNIVKSIPLWYAPPASSPVWELRTFLHKDWAIPILVRIISSGLGVLGGLALGLLAREMFIETWSLPFPIQRISVTAVETLTKARGKKADIFVVSSIIGFIYGIFLYAIPFASNAIGYPLSFIPIPWIDFWYYIQDLFPGASMGIATDIMPFVSGFVVPSNIIIGMFLGSFFIFFLANWILVYLGLTSWAEFYTPGMDIATIWRESVLRLWASPLIGVGIAAGLVPVFLRLKMFSKIMKRLIHFGSEDFKREIRRESFSGGILFLMFIASAAGGVLLVKVLVPDAPIGILLCLFFLWSLVTTMVSTIMVGMTGTGFGAPYIKEMFIYSSGYRSYDIWFAPFPIADGTGWVTSFKQLQLTGTSIGSYIKTWILTWPIALFLSFIFVSAFWKVAPIPSGTYPGAAATWPVRAAYQTLWVTRASGYFRPLWILYSSVVAALFSIIFHIIHMPISMISIAAGMSTPIPVVITSLIGLITGEFMAKTLSRIWWNDNKVTIAAGLVTGEGIAVALGSAVVMVVKSLWNVPY